MGESPMVMEESGKVRVVGLGCLPTHPASGKRVLVVKQTQVVADLGVFDFPCMQFLNCW